MSEERKKRRADVPAAPVDAPLLSSADVAAVLRTTPTQVRHLHQRGQLPGGMTIAGLGLRWRRDRVYAWLEELAR